MRKPGRGSSCWTALDTTWSENSKKVFINLLLLSESENLPQQVPETCGILSADVPSLENMGIIEKPAAFPHFLPYLFHGELFEDRVILVQAQLPEPVQDPVLLLCLRGLRAGRHQHGWRGGVHLGAIAQRGAGASGVGAVGQSNGSGSRVLDVVLGGLNSSHPTYRSGKRE